MAYTKRMGSHGKVTIDGTDVSNSFSEFRFNSSHAQVPAGGFSVSGVAEQLAGETTQSFTGTAFVTEELSAIVYPLHKNRTVCVIAFQPYGLVDSTREIYTGNCLILRWEPGDTFGGVSTMQFEAVAADATGINATDFT